MYDTSLFDVRTDLAIEETERQKKQGYPSYPGVSVDEYDHTDLSNNKGSIHVTTVRIQSEEGAHVLGKAIGTYITLEVPDMVKNDGHIHREISQVLAHYLQDLLKSHFPVHKYLQTQQGMQVLVVGLGNTDVTPDALGPRVLSHILITRHLHSGHFQKPDFPIDSTSVCGIVPGVMAQTGMETAEIIKALADQIHPDIIIVIDALAARSVTRLGTTIQLTDTGIHPGSGVGNHRHSLTQDSLGIPVIAIGVPTVVGAAAIVTDTLDTLIEVLCQETDTKYFADALRSMAPDEKYTLVRELLEPRFGPMFVTPKDIDDTIKRVSFTISEGINLALFGDVASSTQKESHQSSLQP